MKLVRKFSIIVMLIGVCMMVLVGCDSRNNREYLENRIGNEISRVYPTTKIEDLYQEFPDGFKIYQSYVMDKYRIKIELYGTSYKQISGVLKKTVRETSVDEVIIDIEYKDGKFIFSDEQLAKELWPYQGFLFQRMTMNKEFLSKQHLTHKSYSFANGDFGLEYNVKNLEINQFLNLPSNQQVKLEYHGSNSNQGYYYTVVIRVSDGFNFRERISE